MSGVAAAEPGGVWVVTGISAAGKSTVAAALAERFERSVLVEGDLIRELVRGGREEMGPDASPEALAQLRLRYEAAASIASRYAGAGFTCVWDDVVLGAELPTALARVTARPLRLVVLAPDAATDGAREAGRAKDGYHRFDVAGLDRILREETPRLGLWLDTTRLSVAETVDAILGCAGEALVEPGDWSTGAGDVSGGAAAAHAVRLAAELVESVARRSPDWATATAAVAQARVVAARADRLATANEEAFAAALAHPAAETLERSIELPLRIAEAAVDAVLLAEDSAGRCDGRFRADAVAAVLLAEAAARVVEHLVAINLSVRPGDDVVARARQLVEAAHATASRAVDTPT